MINLKQTEREVYYLHEYIPKKNWNEYDLNSIEMSKKLLEYKNDNNDDTFNLFTIELMEAIAYLSNNVMGNEVENIALVPVPPSKVYKHESNTIRKSINCINKLYELGNRSSLFGCSKKFVNHIDLLKRVWDVPTSHLERRPHRNEHIKSIECSKNNLSKEYVTFILIDDITTTGNIMNVCQQILIKHWAVKRYIYKLAIAETIRCDNE